MARNFAKYSDLGEAKIEKNARYSLTADELHFLIDNVSNLNDIYNAVVMSYAAGVEAGWRMRERKKTWMKRK